MRLLNTLAETIKQEDSPFRIQLLREDINRLNALTGALGDQSEAQLRETAMGLSWTASDDQTQRLSHEIHALSDAVWHWHQPDAVRDQADAQVEQAWLALHQTRLQQMVGCLSTPLPKPN